MRADAQKNFDTLVSVAERVFAEQGMSASLKDIAAQAHVGIGTLYRRFPNRAALLEAVYGKRISMLCATAKSLAASLDPMNALRGWLSEVITLVATYRGLDDLVAQALRNEHSYLSIYHTELRTGGEKLLLRAQHGGVIRQDVTIDDLLAVLSALARTQKGATTRSDINRMLSLVVDGLRDK